MRRTTPAAAWPFVVGLFLSLGGCGKADDAANEDDGPNPQAVTVEQAIAAIDLRQFPTMDGATRIDKSPSHAGFSLPNGKVLDAVEFARAKLGALGWKPAADPKLTQVVGAGAQLFFIKDGQRLYAAIGVSPADNNLNFGLFHLGNIDARKLPHFEGVAYTDSLPARTITTTAAKPDDVWKALRKPFVDQGWREYREPTMKEMRNMVREDRTLKFLQQGVGVDVLIMPVEGKTTIYMTIRLQNDQWPIDASAAHIEFQPDPLFLFYPTKLDVKAAVEFNRRELTARGWKPIEGKGLTSADEVTIGWAMAERDPLRLEVIRNQDLTFVMLRPWSKDDDKRDEEKKSEEKK
jgi:hypothetical protein